MIPLRDIRRQISSVRKIGHITRAMKTVSAIRLMKVQTQVVRQKPYAGKLREMVADLKVRTSALAHPLLGRNIAAADDSGSATRSRRIVCLALGSDRGLCGAFNNNLAAAVERFRMQHERDQVILVVIGKRLRDLVHTRRVAIDQEMLGYWHDVSYDKVARLGGAYKDDYLAGRLDELRVIYTEFKSTARQRVAEELLLPVGAGDIAAEPLFPEYRYEPDAARVLERLLPMYYNRELWRAFLESIASEHMARMRAMDMATANAGELIQELTLVLNKARQEIITRELSEISTAAEVLRGA
jgi:F-type H+-transporting ATPase subunit gamma